MPISHTLPVHVPAQIAHYQGNHLMIHESGQYDAGAAVEALQADRQVLAVDLGGDKLRRATAIAGRGTLAVTETDRLQATGGTGYLAFLERLARDAATSHVPVGISSATRLEGSVVRRTVNLPIFFQELATRYGADYARLFSGHMAAVNDTVAGICGSMTWLAQRSEHFTDAAFVICGSGLGGSVVKDGTAYHVEIAHVPLVPELNPLGQSRPCSVEGNEFVCVERVTATRAGIEDLYQRETGIRADGFALAQLLAQGDPLVTLLYDASALALAHALAGLAQRFELGTESVVICHGGTFEIAAYRLAVQRALAGIPGSHPRIVYARDLSANVCLDGAAILALLA